MNKPIHAGFDDGFWQRLVDGQLPQSELRRLIAACDVEPELWKCCAVAFLEEQAFAQTLKQSLDDSSNSLDWLTDGEANSVAAAQQRFIATSEAPRSLRTGSSSLDASGQLGGQHGSGKSGSGMLHMLSLSALILLAFGIGWQASRRVYQSNSIGSIGRDSRSPAEAGPAASSLANSTSSAGHHAELPDRRKPASGNPALIDPNQTPTQTMFVSEGARESSRTLTLDDRLPSELDKLSSLEVGRSYGVVPVTLDGVPALVPLERVEIRAREPY